MWSKAYIWGWVAILLVLAFYEFWAGWGPQKHTPMLTQVTVKFVPWWATMSFLTWLWLHFCIRYASPAYKASLETLTKVRMPF
jgi:hypothetical protein